MHHLGRAQAPALVVVAALVFAGCGLFRPSKSTVSVDDIALAFPTIQRFSAVAYSHEAGQDGEADCQYFQYGRGAFSSKPEDEFCRIYDFDNRQPGGGPEGPVPVAFDARPRTDLAELLTVFKSVGAPLDYMNVAPTSDGSVGPDSYFDFDRCVTYVYQPGWTTLPEDDPGRYVSTGINVDWFKTDLCP
jgi:hypothetical protein